MPEAIDLFLLCLTLVFIIDSGKLVGFSRVSLCDCESLFDLNVTAAVQFPQITFLHLDPPIFRENELFATTTR